MRKKNKKKTKKVDFPYLARLAGVFSLLLHIYTSIFVKGEAVHLSRKIHKVELQIANVELYNEQYLIDIQHLSSYNYVKSAVADSGLQVRLDNIYTIKTSLQ